MVEKDSERRARENPVPDEKGTYRDRLATVDSSGKRSWIYPKKPSGRFYRARNWVSLFLLIILFSGPFITINGHPILLLNILERKFIILGMVFWPQDFILFGLAMIAVIVSIVLFTAIYGRVFCGWVCPQTIFMETVFRRIEYWIEGDAAQQRKLNQAPWDSSKFFKKFSKHLIFYAIAFIIGNTFLAYIIGKDQLFDIITASPTEHLTGFIAMLLFSGVFYWIFSSFREQVCTLVCPYGRLQGVLLDADSVVVSYDNKRGEPRRNLARGDDFSQRADCIDCHRYVDVCPTGIDIRNGTQLECVNCTACIDACDHVMDKVNRPRGLIRYASYNNIEQGTKFRITPRVFGYTSILLLLVSVVLFLLLTRSDIEATILRTPGVLYQEVGEDKIANLYSAVIINKTFDELPVEFRVVKPSGGEVRLIGGPLSIPSQKVAEATFFIDLPKSEVTRVKTHIEIDVYSGDERLQHVKTTFLGPNPFRERDDDDRHDKRKQHNEHDRKEGKGKSDDKHD